MKQTIRLRRVETLTIELEVPQLLERETIERLGNSALSGVGSPAFGRELAHALSDWTVVGPKPRAKAKRSR